MQLKSLRVSSKIAITLVDVSLWLKSDLKENHTDKMNIFMHTETMCVIWLINRKIGPPHFLCSIEDVRLVFVINYMYSRKL